MTNFFYVLAALTVSLIASPSYSASVSELVAERAKSDLAGEMPPLGVFEIAIHGDFPSQGHAIREFWIDHQTGQFIANLVTLEGLIHRISGFAMLMLPVPVSNKRLLPNEIIQLEDIDIVELPWQRVHALAVLDPQEIVGKQVRHLISAGRTFQSQSVSPPILVSRGEQVKIELNQGGLKLLATGKAITDAHLGQEVRVVNLSSNKTITAIARGQGIVEVK